MIVACWSVKGGVGTTVVSAGLALRMGAGSSAPALLVDLAGDLPYCLGLPEPDAPGVAEWSGAGPDVPADALARLARPVGPHLALLARGRGPLGAGRADLLVQLLGAEDRPVVVDCGRPAVGGFAAAVAAAADASLLVTRLCALGLRRAVSPPVAPTGVVVVREPGRALRVDDAVEVVGVPLVADVALDPSVARAVDAGLLGARLPRGFAASLGSVAA